jgi:hypothetical protein
VFEARSGTISGLKDGTGPIGAFVGRVTADLNLSMKPLAASKKHQCFNDIKKKIFVKTRSQIKSSTHGGTAARLKAVLNKSNALSVRAGWNRRDSSQKF